jgi:hypothetical protein
VKIDQEILQELVYAKPGVANDWADGWILAADEERSTGRWEEYRRIIVTKDGIDYWAADYSKGLTEMQEHRWFEDSLFYGETDVPMKPVNRVDETMVVTKYVDADV